MISFLLISMISFAVSQTHEQSLCMTFGNFYESNCPNQGNRAGLVSRQGLPGKRGPIGVKGDRGLKGSTGSKGSSGDANYDLVKEMILQRVEGYCPIRYNGSCFWVAARFDPPISFEEGRDICAILGGKPANIYSEVHYNLVEEYLRSFLIKDDVMHAWLGITYNAQNNTAHLSDGSKAPFMKWYSGYPRRNYCCDVYVEVVSDWKLKTQHMINAKRQDRPRGVICEKRLF